MPSSGQTASSVLKGGGKFQKANRTVFFLTKCSEAFNNNGRLEFIAQLSKLLESMTFLHT